MAVSEERLVTQFRIAVGSVLTPKGCQDTSTRIAKRETNPGRGADCIQYSFSGHTGKRNRILKAGEPTGICFALDFCKPPFSFVKLLCFFAAQPGAFPPCGQTVPLRRPETRSARGRAMPDNHNFVKVKYFLDYLKK